MPTSNPVSSVPVSNASQSKSLRSRLGFGGNNNNNNKSSFFTQLNLKSNRRSFTMHPGDNQTQDQTVLFIDPSSGNGNGEHAPRSATLQNSVRTNFSSLSKATTLHSRIPQRKSVPSSPILYPPSSYSLNLNSRVDLQTPVTTSLLSNAQANINPNDSATSKHLPNLSNDLSLLLNEPAPPDASLSLKSSRESVIHIELPPAKEPFSVHRKSEEPNSLHSVPLSIGMSMETGNAQPDNSGINDSFDLSKARSSLGSVKEGLKERWSRGITLQEISLSNADTIGAAVDISDASLYRSGPITSTPFVNRKATTSQESSFDLDNLDPDLITLLRPNSFQRQLNHIPTPSSEIRHSQSSSRSGPNTFDKLDLDELGSPPISPSRSTYHMDDSDTRRFSKTFVLPSPSSPVRPGQPSQFQASALSYAPKPTVALNRIPWLDSPESEGGQMSSGPSTVSSSNLGTPSDISKPPTPLVSFQQSDRRRPEPFVVNESSARRRKNQNGNTRASPHSMLPSPIEPSSNSSQFQGYVDIRPPSESRQNELNNEIEKPRRNLRHQAIDSLRSEGRPSSVNSSHSFRTRGNSNAGFAEGKGQGAFESRRCRKRSMSVDQTPDLLRLHRTSSETTRSYGSEHTHNVTNGQNLYDERNPDGPHGQRDVGRDRVGGLSPEWLGPKTVKAFAAAGLLDQTRNSSRHLPHTRSVSEYRASSALNNRYRISSNGLTSAENERDRESSRYNPHNFNEHRPSGTRLGAATQNANSLSRPLSRADSWSNSRHVPSLARTISDVTSRRESIDGRDSLGSSYPRTTSGYSITGGTRSESTGSGGRLSPTTTTTNSHIAVQSQFQILKDKYDSQTEALLAALADSQKVCRDLRAENGALKGQIKELEERLVETIATVKQKEKELARARRLYASDRSRPANGKPNDNVQPSLSRTVPIPNTTRSISPPKTRRFSNGSSVFPTIPMSMAMLMAENPGRISVSPPREGTSPPPSPTLVLPKLGPEPKNTLNAPDGCVTSSPIPISHRRSTSVTSISTSANFSFKSGSPGSLKLKPEHEFLLSDLTQISLITALGTDSEAER